MFEIIRKMFIVLLTSLLNTYNASNHTKCVSLSNQNYKVQPNEWIQVKLDKCVGSCNTFNDLSHKLCVPNKTENLNIHVFNIITGKNESKILTKDISCECKCRVDGKNVIQINGEIMINVCVSVKAVILVKNNFIWNPATCNCEHGKYLASIKDDSAISRDEIIDAEETKSVPINFK